MAYFHTTVIDNQIKALPTVDTASGSIATFDTDMTENLVSVIAEISASATKCYLANMSDITNKTYFEGLLNGSYAFVDLGTLNWNYNDGIFYTGIVTTAEQPDNATPAYIINDIYSTRSQDDVSGKVFNKSISLSRTKRINIYDTDYATATPAEFKTAMNGHYVIYKLETPTTPTITKTQFETLLNAFGLSGWLFEYDFGETVSSGATLECVSGTLTRNDDSIKSIGGNILSALTDNNIFASTGDVEVNYILSVGKAIS